LKIVVDALAARFGGTAYMAAQIASALSAREDVEHVWMLVTEGSVADTALRPRPKLTRVSAKIGGRLNLVRRAAWEAVRLPRLIDEQAIDRVLTVSGMLPRHLRCSLVVHLTNPIAYERGGLSNRLRRTVIRRTVRRADALVVPTRAMANLVAADTGLQPIALPLGVDHRVFAPSGHLGEELLYVSDFYAHKRHDIAIDAWLMLDEPRPKLRFIGDPAVDPANFASVVAHARAADGGFGRVLVEGRVPLRKLIEAYARAAIFLMPSEHESFSMPLAEALACGVPAVVRDCSTLRETGAAGALFVASDDAGEWAEALASLIRDSSARHELRELAIRHAERFSWETVAAALVAPTGALAALAIKR
jgi:glycosyltransferase involved in cell wall biosynthesis